MAVGEGVGIGRAYLWVRLPVYPPFLPMRIFHSYRKHPLKVVLQEAASMGGTDIR